MASTEQRNSLGLMPWALKAARQEAMRGWAVSVSRSRRSRTEASAARSWATSSGEEGPLRRS